VSARRAVVRWSWRMLRREWRQQALVLALLTAAVAVSVFGATVAYNVTPVPGRAEFGTGDHFVKITASDPDALRGDLAAARDAFGTIDVIGRRRVPVPGSVATVEIRSQDPRGAYGGPMLALRAGRYPAGADEIAITDGVADALRLELGGTFTLDAAARTVVGVVENPSDLRSEFALAPPGDEGVESATILVRAGDDEVIPFRAPSGAPTTRASAGSLDREGANAATGVLGSATIALFLVALVAGASFVVVAQRRARQLAMLAAIGATEKHLRLVTIVNGALIGSAAALAGVVAGVAGWIAAASFVEPALGHRVEEFAVPWWLVAAGMSLAVATACGAAWWPARSVARIPVTLALSGRPPVPPPVHRSAALAAVLVVGGAAALALADRTNKPLLVAGTLATVAGVLLVAPLSLRLVARCADRLPVAARIALRDLARHQARAGAALAAVSLVLGIAVAIVVSSAAAENRRDEGNLGSRQLLIRTTTVVESEGDNVGGPFAGDRSPGALERLEEAVSRVAAPLDAPVVTPLDVALDPSAGRDPLFPGPPVVTVTRYVGGPRPGWRDISLLYVAIPTLLARHGIDRDAGAELFTSASGRLRLGGTTADPGAIASAARFEPRYASLPGSFVTPVGLRRRGWERVRAGWLVEAAEPLTAAEVAAARAAALGAGLTIESRDRQEDLAAARRRAAGLGILVALAVLAMTVGLIRGEGAGDLRTLAATGASAATRRIVTAATAGALALVGVVLGTLGALLALGAGYLGDLGSLATAPGIELGLIALGVPLLATATGWLLAGREPAGLGRRALD
jgi:putative ABC transport system permease protein